MLLLPVKQQQRETQGKGATMSPRIRFNIMPALYDGEGEGEGGGDNTPKLLSFTQEQLDKLVTDRLKKERADRQAERADYIKQLEDLKSKSGMSAEEKETLEKQIEDLRTANMTVEEQARRARDRDQKSWTEKMEAKEKEAAAWKAKHDALFMKQGITDAMVKHKALPQAHAFINDHLRPRTQLVEIPGEDGKGTGEYEGKVKLPSFNKEGKPIELVLSFDEAVKLMRETPEQYGMLFEGTAIGGTGNTSGGKPAGKPDYSKMSVNDYRKHKAAMSAS